MALLPDVVMNNLSLKLAAIALAVLLWSVQRAGQPARTTIVDVPVDVLVEDPGWTLAEPPRPDSVTVVLTGTRPELMNLLRRNARVVVAIDEVRDSVQFSDLATGMVRLGGALETGHVAEVRPGRVRLAFEPVESGLRPVAVRVRGELPPGVRLSGPITTRPAVVRVSGAVSRLGQLDSVPTQPIDLSTLAAPETLRVAVDTAAVHGFLVSPRQLTAVIPAASVPDSLVAPDTVPSDTAPVDTLGTARR